MKNKVVNQNYENSKNQMSCLSKALCLNFCKLNIQESIRKFFDENKKFQFLIYKNYSHSYQNFYRYKLKRNIKQSL